MNNFENLSFIHKLSRKYSSFFKNCVLNFYIFFFFKHMKCIVTICWILKHCKAIHKLQIIEKLFVHDLPSL